MASGQSPSQPSVILPEDGFVLSSGAPMGPRPRCNHEILHWSRWPFISSRGRAPQIVESSP